MVTLLDVSEDEVRLFDAFEMLRPEAKDEVLQRLAIAAYCAVVARGLPASARDECATPEAMMRRFLMRCMPNIPIAYLDDWGFEHRYRDHARPRLEWRCISLVLGSTGQDAANARELAEALTESAIEAASGSDTPDFAEEGWVDVEEVQQFIERWRDNFSTNLDRVATRAAAQ